MCRVNLRGEPVAGLDRSEGGDVTPPMFRTVALFALLGVSGCTSFGLFDTAGPVAEAQRAHLVSIVLWMLVVVVPLFVALPLIIWRYRLGGRATYRPEWEFSWSLEVLIWGLPVLIVSVLGWNLWVQTLVLDPYAPLDGGAPLQVQAIGLDWKWLFVYPDLGIASANVMAFPADRPVRFRITSGTALQSFMIPRLGGQVYAMPGMVSEINLAADAPGEFLGLNTQYNGAGFAQQKFTATATAMTPADFDAWVAQARAGAPLDDAALGDLAQRSVLPAPLIFGTVDGTPFDTIVERVKAGRPLGDTPGQGDGQ